VGTNSGVAAARAQAAPSLVENRAAAIRLPDEFELIRMERNADMLLENHAGYRENGWGDRIPTLIPCGCARCNVWKDLTELIALVRRLRA